MSKPEWGMKRTCTSCSVRFYDMKKDPIVCPKCETTFDPEVLTKKRRGRPPAAEAKKKEPAKKKEEVVEVDIEEDAVSLETSDDVLEDTSDFGEDEAVVDVDKPAKED